MSPGHWGPSPTPPGFRGTRPGAGAPLPHRLRLPLKPLRSGHRFLGSPSQGQAGWPTGGAPRARLRGSRGGRRPRRAPGLPSQAPRWAKTAKASGSWAGRTLAGRSFLGGSRLQARRSPDQEDADTRRGGGVSAPREHPTRPAAGMWGEGGKSKRAVLRWPSQTPTRRFGEEPEPQDAEVPIKQVRDKTEPRDRISIFSPERAARGQKGDPKDSPERETESDGGRDRWAGPLPVLRA